MTLNPNNYQGVNAVIVGTAGGPAENPPYDKDGSRGYQQVSVAVGQGYKKDGEWVDTGTLWITYTASASDLASVGKGDKIRLDDVKLEAREFTRKDGSIGQAFEARFGTLTVLESKGGGSQSAGFAADEGSPF